MTAADASLDADGCTKLGGSPSPSSPFICTSARCASESLHSRRLFCSSPPPLSCGSWSRSSTSSHFPPFTSRPTAISTRTVLPFEQPRVHYGGAVVIRRPGRNWSTHPAHSRCVSFVLNHHHTPAPSPYPFQAPLPHFHSLSTPRGARPQSRPPKRRKNVDCNSHEPDEEGSFGCVNAPRV